MKSGFDRGRPWILALLALAAASGAPSAAGPDAPEALAGLQRWLDGTRQLQCNFVQELLSGALGSGLKESGRLYIARPGRMRWDYLEPERKVALIDGQRTTLYVEEDRELVRGRLDGEGELLPALLVGEGRLAGLFSAELLAVSAAGVELRLVPLRAGEAVEETG